MPLVNMNGLDTVPPAPERVWAAVDPALLAARDQHQDALERAQADATAAQQRLDEHQAQMPDDLAAIPTWACQKAELAAELEAYRGLSRAPQNGSSRHSTRLILPIGRRGLRCMPRHWQHSSARRSRCGSALRKLNVPLSVSAKKGNSRSSVRRTG
jgi:hypothetical protein